MDIYRNRTKFGSIPDKLNVPNRFFTRLKGINIDQKGETAEIEGVYRSAFAFWKSGGIRCIDIVIRNRHFTIFLSPVYPFFTVLETDRQLFGSEE